MANESQAAQRGRLVSRLRPPTSIAKPAFDPAATNAATDPAEDADGYDPDKDMFAEQQAALEADAAKRRKQKNKKPSDDEIIEPGNVTGSY